MNDYRGRRPANRGSNVLPTGKSRHKAPGWPLGEPDDAERVLWADLWGRPVAHLWRSMHIAPIVVARYVRVVLAKPESGGLAQQESALGLTPASLRRLQVTFEEPTAPSGDDEVQALLDAAIARWEASR